MDGKDYAEDMQEKGMPTYDEYVEMRDKITNYTAGNMVMTSWKWPKASMEPGDSAGLCLASPTATDAFYSCWAFPMGSDGKIQEKPSSYLVDPATWTDESRLDTYEDITRGVFPAMYGGWMCFPPTEIMDNYYSDCMRFLPSPEVSSTEDFLYEEGSLNVMTYLTSRQGSGEPLADGSEVLNVGEESVFEMHSVDISYFTGSGASSVAAAGLAFVSTILMSF